MKKRPLALLLALLTLVGPATFVAARPGGNRGGGDRGGPPKGAVNGVVASVDARTSSFILHLEGKRGRRRSQTQDVTVRTNAKTVFTLGDRSQGSFSDVVVGGRALVKGTRNTDGSLLAEHVALKAARPPKETSVKGIVDYIDEDTLSFLLAARARGRDGVAHDILVLTNAHTVFKNADDSAASFADLTEGDAVDARGVLNAEGSLQATSVRIHGEDEPQPVKFRGVVDSVDAETSSFSLHLGGGRTGDAPDAPSVLLHTDANTVYTKPDGSLGSFADVVVGVSAAVAATRHGDGFLARSVQLIAPEPPREVGVRGTIASIDAPSTSFVLKPSDDKKTREDRPGILVHTSSATAFQKADGSAATFADLAIGGRVAVKGTANDDRSLNASLVLIAGEEPPHEVSLRGAVAKVDAASKSFLLHPGDGDDGTREDRPGILVHTSNATSFQKADGSPATFADIVVGAHVGAKGTLNDDRSVNARVVFIAGDEPPHEVGLHGAVVSVDGAAKSFVVKPGDEREASPVERPSVTVHTDDHTAFMKADGTVATFADIVVGERVAVKGTVNDDRSLNAKVVVIGGEEPPQEQWIGGVVGRVDGETFTLTRPTREDGVPPDDAIVVHTDEHTVFTKDGQPGTLADVEANRWTKCRGTFNADGSFQATLVAVSVLQR